MPLGPPHGQRCRGRVWRGGLWVLPQLLWKRPLAAWVPPFGCKSRLLPHGVCPWDTRGGRCRAPMPRQRGVGGLWPQALLQLWRFLASCSIPPLQRWPQLLHLALPSSPAASSWLSGMGLGQFRPPPLGTLLFLRGRWLAGKGHRVPAALLAALVACRPVVPGQSPGDAQLLLGVCRRSGAGTEPSSSEGLGKELGSPQPRSNPPWGAKFCAAHR